MDLPFTDKLRVPSDSSLQPAIWNQKLRHQSFLRFWTGLPFKIPCIENTDVTIHPHPSTPSPERSGVFRCASNAI